jgi:hypothetical protein
MTPHHAIEHDSFLCPALSFSKSESRPKRCSLFFPDDSSIDRVYLDAVVREHERVPCDKLSYIGVLALSRFRSRFHCAFTRPYCRHAEQVLSRLRINLEQRVHDGDGSNDALVSFDSMMKNTADILIDSIATTITIQLFYPTIAVAIRTNARTVGQTDQSMT